MSSEEHASLLTLDLPFLSEWRPRAGVISLGLNLRYGGSHHLHLLVPNPAYWAWGREEPGPYGERRIGLGPILLLHSLWL